MMNPANAHPQQVLDIYNKDSLFCVLHQEELCLDNQHNGHTEPLFSLFTLRPDLILSSSISGPLSGPLKLTRDSSHNGHALYVLFQSFPSHTRFDS